MAFFPKVLGGLHRPNPKIRPPGLLIAKLVELSMMASAKRHCELVADFEAQRSRLSKLRVMRIGRLPSADQTRLRGHEPKMAFVTQPLGFRNRQNAFVYLARDQIR
jgi:hypothetical protein